MKLSKELNVLLEKEDGSVSFKYPILKTAEYPHPELVDNIQGFAVQQGAETLHNSYHTHSKNVKYTTEVDRYINWINALCEAYKEDEGDAEEYDYCLDDLEPPVFIDICVHALLGDIESSTFLSLSKHFESMGLDYKNDPVKFIRPLLNAIYSAEFQLNEPQRILLKAIVENFRVDLKGFTFNPNSSILRLYVLGDKNINLMVYSNLLRIAELDSTGRRFKSLKSWAQESFDTLSDILWEDKQKRFSDGRPSEDVKTFYLSILTFAAKSNKYAETYFNEGYDLKGGWDAWLMFRKARSKRQ